MANLRFPICVDGEPPLLDEAGLFDYIRRKCGDAVADYLEENLTAKNKIKALQNFLRSAKDNIEEAQYLCNALSDMMDE